MIGKKFVADFFSKFLVILLMAPTLLMTACENQTGNGSGAKSSSATGSGGSSEGSDDDFDGPPSTTDGGSSPGGGSSSQQPGSGTNPATGSGSGQVQTNLGNWSILQPDNTVFGDKLRSIADTDSCIGLAKDSKGNIICAGLGLQEDSVFGTQRNDIFVAKINVSGSIIWAKQLKSSISPKIIDSSRDEILEGVAVDQHDNIVLVGSTESSFGEVHSRDHINDSHLSGPRPRDSLIVKMNTDGEIVWVTQLGSITKKTANGNIWDDRCYAVAIDSMGDIYCSGFTMGPMALGEMDGISADGIVMKLNSAGQLKWLVQFGPKNGFPDQGTEELRGITVDNKGFVYVVGDRRASAPADRNFGLFAKLRASDGLVQLKKQIVNYAVSNKYHQLMLESIKYSVKHDALLVGGQTLGKFKGELSKSWDVAVLKMDLNGNEVWRTQLNASTIAPQGHDNSATEACESIAVDEGTGNIYCAGYTYSNYSQSNMGAAYVTSDAFIAVLNANGSYRGAYHLGAEYADFPTADFSKKEICFSALVHSDSILCGGFTFGGRLKPNAIISSPSLFIWKNAL